MKKILFLAIQERNKVPGQRFRIEQYIDYLRDNGISIDISPMFYPEEQSIVYDSGSVLKKSILYAKMLRRRYDDFLKIKNNGYDGVFIYREAIYGRNTIFEELISKTQKPIIFDFDDAIWLNDTAKANLHLKWLKSKKKTSKIARLAKLVTVGNDYLADYAKQFNPNTMVIPTTIDTNYHRPMKKTKTDNKIVIGWSGSVTTLKHFNILVPVLKQIKQKYPQVEIKVIAHEKFKAIDLEVKSINWNFQTEIEDMSDFDIGIMPLPNDDWSRGKCGFKGLAFMSMEIPTIMSPVGVNKEIIQDGVNGFLAANDKEWIDKISLLIESEELRVRLGKEGRKTVIEKYSVEANKNKWLEAFKFALNA